MKLATEATLVGLVTAVTFAIVMLLAKPATVWGLLGVGFGVGVALHLLFEVVGANGWYCRHGHACT